MRSHAFEGPENQWSTDHDQKIPLLPSPFSCQSKPPLPFLPSPSLLALCLYPWVISVSQTKAKNTKEEGGRAVACWIHYSTQSAICNFRLFDRPLNHCCKKRTAVFLPDFSPKKFEREKSVACSAAAAFF